MSKTEREFILSLYSNNVLNKDDIKDVYPSLFSYLYSEAEDSIEGKDAYKDYLRAYRESKVYNIDNQ